jgi:hypothetical protein
MDSTARNGYECFDDLIRQLRSEGHGEFADRLEFLLHRVAWTMASELIGELGLALLAFERSKPSVSAALRPHLDLCMRFVRRVWPEIRLE